MTVRFHISQSSRCKCCIEFVGSEMRWSFAEQSAPKREVWFFFVAIFIINSVFVIGVGQDWIPRHYFPQGRFFLLGGTLAVVVLLSRGPGSVLGLLKPLSVWRISPLWFVLAFLWPILFCVLFVIGQAVMTGAPVEIFAPGVELLRRQRFLVNIFIAALVGEIVWVGYAIRNLSKSYSLTGAALITGTFWGLWWLPMVIYEVGIVPELSFLGLWMNMVGIAFFCAFFYTLTGSGLVILVMQFCFNSCVLAFPVLPNTAGPIAYQVFSGLYMVVGFLFLTVLLPRLQRRGDAVPA